MEMSRRETFIKPTDHAGGMARSFSSINRKIHARKRRILAPGMTDKALSAREDTVLYHIRQFFDRAPKENAVSTTDKGDKWIADMGTWGNYLTFDVMADMTFGNKINLIKGSEYLLPNSSFSNQESMEWNLGLDCEVYDVELFAKALEIELQRPMVSTINLWIFSDSQAALKGLRSGQNGANKYLYQKIYKIAESLKSKGIINHIHWVPGHLGIYGNEKADQAARYGADWQEHSPSSQGLGLSISFVSRKVKNRF
jgi:hypothetical protein